MTTIQSLQADARTGNDFLDQFLPGVGEAQMDDRKPGLLAIVGTLLHPNPSAVVAGLTCWAVKAGKPTRMLVSMRPSAVSGMIRTAASAQQPYEIIRPWVQGLPDDLQGLANFTGVPPFVNFISSASGHLSHYQAGMKDLMGVLGGDGVRGVHGRHPDSYERDLGETRAWAMGLFEAMRVLWTRPRMDGMSFEEALNVVTFMTDDQWEQMAASESTESEWLYSRI